MRTRILLCAAAAALLFACGGDDDDGGSEPDPGKPEDAFERQLRFLSDGQAVRAYNELHPIQREFISERLYVSCVDDAPSFEVGEVTIKEVFDEEITIPGTETRAQSKAITAEVEVIVGDDRATTTDTYHEFLVDGRWVFTVSDGEAYREGRCP